MIHLLILTHNRIDAVTRCFESLEPTLARRDVRCIVLDNASTDGTADYLAQVPHIQLLRRDVNLGVAHGRAELINEVTGCGCLKSRDRVVFLDSDTEIVSADWLEVLLAALEPEHVGVVGPGGSFVLGNWAGFTAGAPGEVDCVAGYCQVIKGEVLLAGVTIDTAYHGFWTEDSDFCLAVREAGWDVLCVPVGVLHSPSHSGFGQDMSLHDSHIAMFRQRWQGQGLIRAEGGY